MSYDEYYKMLDDYIYKSIKTTNFYLHKKIYTSILNWYDKYYKKKIKNYILEEKYSAVLSLSKQIYSVCSLSDYEKLEFTFECKELSELNALSDEIFNLVKTKIKSDITIDKEKVDEYVNKLNELSDKIPKILENKYDYIKSECLLDIDYLIMGNKVKYYSLRTSDYLKYNV